MTRQDTGKYRKNNMDQYYTIESIAKQCIDTICSSILNAHEYIWIEPSAGNGAFLNNVPTTFKKIGIDIDPKSDTIEKVDFMTWIPPRDEKILVFGNPPFGKQSSLAKSFIKKSCQFADIIAFILPKSFTKPSMYNAFDKLYHCLYTCDIPPNAFIVNGEPYNVPCVFQIWKKDSIPRQEEPKQKPCGFQYVKLSDTHDLVFRRVGVNAGRCYRPGVYSPQSHYFLKIDETYLSNLDDIIQKINNHTFPSNTVGPRSLSKQEVNIVLNRILLEYASSR